MVARCICIQNIYYQLSELEKKTCEKQVLNRKNKDKLRYKRRPKIIDPSTGELVKERLRHFCSYPGCGKGFTAPSKLKLLIPSHTGEKNHQCTVCGNRYPRKKSLDKHMISHTGVSKFISSFCGKAFKWQKELETHQRVHTVEKALKCTECGKCFSTSSVMKVHMRIYTGERPVECNKCHQKFMLHAGKSNHKCV